MEMAVETAVETAEKAAWPSPFMASSEPSPMKIDPWGRQTDPSRTRVDDDGRSGVFLPRKSYAP